jgi:preprotein translocase subunit SecG
MLTFLAVAQVLIVVSMISLILMHSGRDAGIGGMGFTPQSQGGTHIVERNLTRVTMVVAVIFTINAVVLFRWLQ